MTNKDLLFGGIVSVVSAIAICALKAARESSRKVDRICNRLDASFEEIQARTVIDISDDLIDSVVSDMAKRKVDRVIPKSVDDAVAKIKDETISIMRNDVLNKVNCLAPVIEKDLQEQLGRVSIDDMKKAVIDKAVEDAKREYLADIRSAKDDQIEELKMYYKVMKDEIDDKVDDIVEDLQDMAEDKFKEELDDLTTRYKSRLDDVSNIYASFANKVTK